MDLSEVFKDVTPIPQDDGPNPVCSIDYANGFVEAMDYFRAILKMNEHSGKSSAREARSEYNSGIHTLIVSTADAFTRGGISLLTF